jgi:hypothetical protein
LNDFAEWLATTAPSMFIRSHQVWTIPTIQSIHILAIGVVIGSVFLMSLRIFGLAGMDQTVREINRRFSPWLTWGLWVLAGSGLLLIIGEPVRELITFSFWAKMILLAAAIAIASSFVVTVKKHESAWDEQLAKRTSVRVMAALTLLIWFAIIMLGRLIAYDYVWGALSPAARQ